MIYNYVLTATTDSGEIVATYSFKSDTENADELKGVRTILAIIELLRERREE